MITPTVHMNGTSGGALLEQQLKVVAALGAALVAMSDAYPNGRDYYPQGSSAISVAMAEHAARMDAIEAIREQYNQIAEAISDQMVTT